MERAHKSYVGYMTHPILKKHGTYGWKVIKKVESAFKAVTVKIIKNELTTSNVSVLSLIMFHDNRKIFMDKVIGAVIYTIIGDYICLDYMCLLQENSSKHDNKF